MMAVAGGQSPLVAQRLQSGMATASGRSHVRRRRDNAATPFNALAGTRRSTQKVAQFPLCALPAGVIADGALAGER